MRNFPWRTQITNKHCHLLAILASSFFIFPLGGEGHYYVLPLMFMAGIMFSLRASEIKRPVFWAMLAVGVSALIVDLWFYLSPQIAAGWVFREVPVLIYAVFLLLAIILLIAKMFSVSRVTTDTIAGGISVYLLMGFLWTVFYYAIFVADPNAFSSSLPFNEYSLIHFSFVTLTTVGYGDIYPVNKLAMSLSNLESITGQLYLAIFITR